MAESVKITVTPFCSHPDGYINHGQSMTGDHAVIGSRGVILDGRPVVWRDRRVKANRTEGHPWHTATDKPHVVDEWTGFTVSVEP